ncbi:MAG TPA: glycosyltransferase family 2 protein [Paludibacter sp.]|nr:glycosyltransferase family 2 protein [Paludibacter sp.]
MITISIVLYNHSVEEIKLLISPLQSCGAIWNIYLVDNSPAANPDFEKLPVVYMFTGKNLGYGSAHNIAIRESIKEGIKYHLVLNPDIRTTENVIEQLVDFMDTHEEVGLCMPNIVYPNMERQHLCKLLPAPTDLIFRRFFPTQDLKKKHDAKFELQIADYHNVFYAPSLSGCFMFMRTEILQKVNGFDERFFMYCEDLDLCRRINAFSELRYVPTEPVIHQYNKESYRKVKLLGSHICSAIKYFNKWGWIFDKERKIINRKTLKQLNL